MQQSHNSCLAWSDLTRIVRCIQISKMPKSKISHSESIKYDKPGNRAGATLSRELPGGAQFTNLSPSG